MALTSAVFRQIQGNKVSHAMQDLADCKQALTAMEMEGMVGEEQNNLLDYLRSLEPDKVCNLSSWCHPNFYYAGHLWSPLGSSNDLFRGNVDFHTKVLGVLHKICDVNLVYH
jgi:hypothetical protein